MHQERSTTHIEVEVALYFGSITLAARRFAGASVLALAGVAAPALASDSGEAATASDVAPPPSEAWEFTVAPYIWFSGMEGTVSAGPVDSEFDVPFLDIAQVLDFGFLGNAEARRGKLSLTGNLIYMKLSGDTERATGSVLPNAPPGDLSVDTVMDTLIVEAAVNYEVASAPLFGDGRQIALDVRGGFRAWWLENDVQVELDPGSPLGPFKRKFHENGGWVDFVIGARVRAQPTEKIGLVLSGDVGGFDIGSSSKLTWSVTAFGTYQITEHWLLGAGWRGIDIDNGVADIFMSGPLLGAVYRY
jgi:hypothetical protein